MRNFCFLFVICFLRDGRAMLLDLFGDKDRHGMSIRVEVSENDCSNFPISWSSKAASINTLGSCVQLYDEPLCKGALTIMQPFHTIHQMDLSLINFANRIQSAAPCGPKPRTGLYILQNSDATILTVSSKYGGFARAFTTNASTLITKAQQWDVIEMSDSNYSLKPRAFEDNYPVTYDEALLKQGKIKKKVWKLMSVGRGRYLIKSEPSQRCLYKTEDNRVEEHDCRIFSPNQEWMLKQIFGPPKQKKKINSVGPGVNFNILSKVASYHPPTKSPPQFEPILYNASALAAIKRKTTPAPYVIRKKIKRGPRPPSQSIPLLNYIRPPGLREKPALSDKIANNNKFLFLKKPPNPLSLKEFVPSDDRIETYAYYQQALLAKKQEEEIRKQQRLPQFPPPNKPLPDIKKSQEEEDSISEEVEDDGGNNNEDSGSNEDDDTDHSSEENYNGNQKESEKKASQHGNSKTQNKFNPYDIKYNNITTGDIPPQLLQDEISSSFFQSMFSRVKSGLGSFVPNVQIPFLSSSTGSSKIKSSTTANKNA